MAKTQMRTSQNVVILMYTGHNCLPGEAQTEVAAHRELLMNPKKKQPAIWREEAMAVALPNGCWVLRRRAQKALPVGDRQGEQLSRLPQAGLHVRDCR